MCWCSFVLIQWLAMFISALWHQKYATKLIICQLQGTTWGALAGQNDRDPCPWNGQDPWGAPRVRRGAARARRGERVAAVQEQIGTKQKTTRKTLQNATESKYFFYMLMIENYFIIIFFIYYCCSNLISIYFFIQLYFIISFICTNK